MQKIEAEQLLKKRRASLEQAGLPPLRKGLKFDEHQREAMRRIWEMATAKDSDFGAICFLTGDRGVGKTEMMSRFIEYFVMQGEGYGAYRKLADLLNLRILYSDKGFTDRQWREAERERDRFANRYHLLVIDEIHENQKNVYAADILTDVIDRRYRNGRHTVLISNLAPESLRENLNPSIIDRARQFGGIISTIGWRNYRKS